MLLEIGFSCAELRNLIRRIQETVENASYYKWLNREYSNWLESYNMLTERQLHHMRLAVNWAALLFSTSTEGTYLVYFAAHHPMVQRSDIESALAAGPEIQAALLEGWPRF